jgi:S-adenosylmethionine:tRNA ribosyltransferase-isomerase
MEPWIEYTLPDELVAQEPLNNRVDARLMVVDRSRGAIAHHHIRDFPRLLLPGDRLVLNDTRVIPAQLRGLRTATGGRWQGLFLGHSDETDGGEGDWRLVCKTRGRLKPMEQITLLDRDGKPTVTLWLLEKLDGGQWLARPETELPTNELLDRIGRVPLPPYIRGGNMVDADVRDYQTVFAKRPGAVAAPTAGLHFTEDLLRAIKQSGTDFSSVTLHVGLGTFQPISVEDPSEHPMHSEWGELSETVAQELNATRAADGRNIAVGTTVTRVLESAVAAQQCYEGGVQEEAGGALRAWQGETDLYIRPPYEFQAIDALLTNFHFPRTTLLLLVQAFGGSQLIRHAYEEAIKEEYRFYSYGDAMLVV